MAVKNTRFEITSTGEEYKVPGEWTVETIVNQFSDQVPGIANMDATREADEDGGETIVFTFSPRTGTKG